MSAGRFRGTWGLALVAAVALAACDAGSASPSAGSSPQPAVSPSSTAASNGDWGPLAVVAPSAGADMARNEGTVEIDDPCVLLTRGTDRILLIWPADLTTWNAATNTIEFRNRDGTTTSIRDGSALVVGGSGESLEESGLTAEALLARVTWVARPDASCPLDEVWFVGDASAMP